MFVVRPSIDIVVGTGNGEAAISRRASYRVRKTYLDVSARAAAKVEYFPAPFLPTMNKTSVGVRKLDHLVHTCDSSCWNGSSSTGFMSSTGSVRGPQFCSVPSVNSELYLRAGVVRGHSQSGNRRNKGKSPKDNIGSHWNDGSVDS